MLTNLRSERVRSVRALGRRSARQRSGLFVADGPQAVREAIAHRPRTVAHVYAEAGAQPDLVAAARRADLPVDECTPQVLAAMSDAQHPQGVVAVCRFIDVDLERALDRGDGFVVVLTHVRDPGNAGTVIRGADATGARCVVLSEGSVDIYNPKVVRSTAGSLWHLPIVRGPAVDSIVAACRAHGIRLLAADGSGALLLPQVDLHPPHAWVMGNEAWGLPEEIRKECDEVVRVPIYGAAESLNLAMAATCCMYASAGVLYPPPVA